MKTLFSIVLFVLSTVLAFAQPGTLDPTFNSDGMFPLEVGAAFDVGTVILEQEDGKVVVAGYSDDTFDSKMFLYRCLPSGDADPTFGTNGLMLLDPSTEDDFIHAGVVQDDGKMVFMGITEINGPYGIGVYRFNPDGSYDTSFDNDGIAIHYFPTPVIAKNIALQPDGKMVIFGNSLYADGDSLAVVRLHANGALDQSFSGDGVAYFSPGLENGNHTGTCGLVQPSGKILIGGYGADLNLGFLLSRLNTDGTLDNTFGINGSLYINVGNGICNGVAYQNGKIYAAGFARVNSLVPNKFTVIRINDNGTADLSYGTDAIASHGTNMEINNDRMNAFMLQPDGKAILAGFSNGGGVTESFSMVRFSADGTIDTDFGTNGETITPLGPNADQAWAGSLGHNGDIYLTGVTTNSTGNWSVGVAKYVNDLNLSVNEGEEGAHLMIYPNPAQDRISIQLSEKNATVYLYDSAGKRVYEDHSIGIQATIETANMPRGLYLLVMQSKAGAISKKLVLN